MIDNPLGENNHERSFGEIRHFLLDDPEISRITIEQFREMHPSFIEDLVRVARPEDTDPDRLERRLGVAMIALLGYMKIENPEGFDELTKRVAIARIERRNSFDVDEWNGRLGFSEESRALAAELPLLDSAAPFIEGSPGSESQTPED